MFHPLYFKQFYARVKDERVRYKKQLNPHEQENSVNGVCVINLRDVRYRSTTT